MKRSRYELKSDVGLLGPAVLTLEEHGAVLDGYEPRVRTWSNDLFASSLRVPSVRTLPSLSIERDSVRAGRGVAFWLMAPLVAAVLVAASVEGVDLLSSGGENFIAGLAVLSLIALGLGLIVYLSRQLTLWVTYRGPDGRPIKLRFRVSPPALARELRRELLDAIDKAAHFAKEAP